MRSLTIGFLFLTFFLTLGHMVSDASSPNKEKVMEMYESYQKDFSNIEHIKASELKRLQKKPESERSYVLVDARSEEERAVSKIPTAISLEKFEENRLQYKKKKVIAYCTIGYRSGRLTEELREDGYDAYNLRGSLLGWIHNGGQVVNPEGEPVQKVHVYGSSWNMVPEGWKSIW
jgi:rhodanese-related sulfurtransferase